MFRLAEQESPVRPPSARVSIHEQWTQAYGSLVAEQLHPERCYTLIRVGSVEFAYTHYERYLRALGQAWAAGFVPDPRPSECGRDLPTVAPNLQGVDLDLGELSTAEIEPSPRRYP